MNTGNPYEVTSVERQCSDSVDPRIAATYCACLLLFGGFLLFTFCVATHVCICGHLKHKEAVTLPIHWGVDVLLGTVFFLAVHFARRSFFVHTNTLAFLLTLIYLDHMLLANGAGYLFVVFDLPIMLLIAIRCVARLRWARIYATAV